MKRIFSAVVALVMTLALCASLSVAALAAGTGRTGSITVEFKSDASGTMKYLAGDTFSLKRIASGTGTMVSDLDHFSYSWFTMSDKELQDAIDKVDDYCRRHDLYEASGKTDAEGKVTFDGLSQGIYLFARTDYAEENKEYIALSGIVAIPSEDPETGGILWDMTVQPKPGYNGQTTPTDPEDPRYVPDPKTTTTTRTVTTTRRTVTTTNPGIVKRITNRVNTDSARTLNIAIAVVVLSGAALAVLAFAKRKNTEDEDL